MQQKYFWKKLATASGMLIEQSFELRGTGLPGPCMYSYNWLFSWQNNDLEGKFSGGLLFTAKTIAGGNVLYFPLRGPKSLTKFNPKMQDFKRVLDFKAT